MSRLRRLCGTAPEGRVSWALRRRWRPRGQLGRAVVIGDGVLLGPVTRWSRDQAGFPACGGNACSAIIEALYPDLPRVSAVDIWRGARRRLGLPIEDLSNGTKWSAIWAELESRGVDEWRPGEDEDPVEGGRGAAPAGDNLRDELRSADRKGLVRVYRIASLDDVDLAIAEGHAVGISTGTRDGYVSLRADEVATPRELGGKNDGHAQRVVGRVLRDGRRLYVLQNSWGAAWSGCHAGGLWLPGHALVDEQCIKEAWQLWGVTRARP